MRYILMISIWLIMIEASISIYNYKPQTRRPIRPIRSIRPSRPYCPPKQKIENSKSCSESKEEPCPNLADFKVDLNNKAEAAVCALNFVNSQWISNDGLLSEKSRALGRVIISMATSNCQLHKDVASLVTAWFFSALHEIDCKPNACCFAETVNTTVKSNTGIVDCVAINCSLNNIYGCIRDGVSFIGATALKNAGCSSQSYKPTAPDCYKQGMVYLFRELWNTKGRQFPCALKTAAFELYNSKSYTDQYLAAVVSAGICDSFRHVYNSYNLEPMYRAFQMQSTGPVPKRCYKNVIAQWNEIFKGMMDSAAQSTLSAKKAAGCAQ